VNEGAPVNGTDKGVPGGEAEVANTKTTEAAETAAEMAEAADLRVPLENLFPEANNPQHSATHARLSNSAPQRHCGLVEDYLP
jgi:hypothetical protein